MTITAFFSGMITMGFVIASLFFFRFWRRTGDWMFIIFGVSFCLFAIGQALTSLSGIPREEQSWIYLLRLAGFGLLIVGIAAKNISPSATKSDRGKEADGVPPARRDP